MKRLLDWFDDRTGYRDVLSEMLYEKIPGGARWRYITGSMLVFAFVTQAITGIFLWMAFSPSSQTAWESVYYIQYQMQGGWLLRGIHHFMANAMIVLLVLHLFQVVWDRAYRPPREFNFWTGMVLMLITLGLALTGYLLPWDQKGYWATSVATNLMGLDPVLGETNMKLAVGGTDYGHHTLTRFFAMHAGVLPALLVAVLAIHIFLFRRHGVTAHQPDSRPDDYFWPLQVLKDGIACLIVLVIVLLSVIHFDIFGALSGNLPVEHRGAELGAPADPSWEYSAARPEWYFLFLFQFLKYFKGDSEILGAIVIPGLVVLMMFLMPIVGARVWGHRLNLAFLGFLIFGAAGLTSVAMYEDKYGEASTSYLKSVVEAHQDAERIKQLVGQYGIPPTGALELMRSDPKIMGQRLFNQKCASCHKYDENGNDNDEQQDNDPPNGGANLYGFASRNWLRGFLDPAQIDQNAYFGNTAHREGKMVKWVKEHMATFSEDETEDIVIALSAQAQLRNQAEQDSSEQQRIDRGNAMINAHCTECHRFGSKGSWGAAPDLTGYGSRSWMMAMIADPAHKRFYRGSHNDRMPASVDVENLAADRLSIRQAHQVSLIVDWLRGDYYQEDEIQATVHPSNHEAYRELLEALQEGQDKSPASPQLSPREQAASLFRQHCANCHTHLDTHGNGIASDQPSAPNLFGFGSRDWLRGLLSADGIQSVHYFGETSHAEGDMAQFVENEVEELSEEGQGQLEQIIIALSAEAALKSQQTIDEEAQQAGVIQAGQKAIAGEFETSSTCIDCHKFHDDGDLGAAPDLTGYASQQWLRDMISNPEHERLYGFSEDANDRMPAFRPSPDNEQDNILTDQQLDLLINWLRGE